MRGQYALVGMAESAVGVVPDKSPRELCVEVTLNAIKDAGLTLTDCDGLITCNAFAEPILYHAEAVAEYLGWQPRHCVTVNTGGGTTFMAINMAVAAVSGAMLPKILKALSIDPAIAGTVVLTTITDVVGFLTFLGMATYFYA